MTATLPSIAEQKPNPAWALLPLFGRTGWKRVRSGDVLKNAEPKKKAVEIEIQLVTRS
jgi:hypothetical protein